MRYVADLCIAALFGLTVSGAVACQFGDNSFPADAAPDGHLGPRDDIRACCKEWRPWATDAPLDCLNERCEPGVCRWLTCAVFWTYRSEACR